MTWRVAAVENLWKSLAVNFSLSPPERRLPMPCVIASPTRLLCTANPSGVGQDVPALELARPKSPLQSHTPQDIIVFASQ